MSAAPFFSRFSLRPVSPWPFIVLQRPPNRWIGYQGSKSGTDWVEDCRDGHVVQMNDELRTGANARLQITFRDGTLLTLGENARVVIDHYVSTPKEHRRDGPQDDPRCSSASRRAG